MNFEANGSFINSSSSEIADVLVRILKLGRLNFLEEKTSVIGFVCKITSRILLRPHLPYWKVIG